jgi:hypothetical protein
MPNNPTNPTNPTNPEFYVDALYKAANINDKLLTMVVKALVSLPPKKSRLKPNLIPDALRSIMGELLDATPVSSERLSELERKVVAADALDHEKDEVLKIIARKRVSTLIPFL